MTSAEDALRRLAINDERQIAAVLRMASEPEGALLDPRTRALARLTALIAVDAAPVSIEHAVSDAIAQGASSRDIVCLLGTICPALGYPRVVAAAPAIAGALGYDIDAALEVIQPPADRLRRG